MYLPYLPKKNTVTLKCPGGNNEIDISHPNSFSSLLVLFCFVFYVEFCRVLMDGNFAEALSQCFETFQLVSASGKVPSLADINQVFFVIQFVGYFSFFMFPFFQMIMRSKSIVSILPTTEDNENRHSMLQTIIATLETIKSQLEAKEIKETSPCNEMNDDERMDTNE